MIKIYSDEDFSAISEQKRKVFLTFIGVSAVYLAICIACLIYHVSLPYGDPLLPVPEWIIYITTVIFVAFSFPYLGIKYYRVRKYYRMLYYVSEGIKNDEQNYFVRFENCDLQKDFVDVVACVFMIWNKKKQEWMKRIAYIDAEKTLPDFKSGDFVRYITQGNFIIQYEVLAREVLEIEEYDDEDGYEYEPEEAVEEQLEIAEEQTSEQERGAQE